MKPRLGAGGIAMTSWGGGVVGVVQSWNEREADVC